MIDFSAKPSLQTRLHRDGFAFVSAKSLRKTLTDDQLADWHAFAASWNDLPADTYLAAASGRQRRRRHAIFSAVAGSEIRRLPQRPHFQTLANNPLQGDIQRWFAPIRPSIADGPSLRHILDFGRKVFEGVAPGKRDWQIEVHQFRIEARVGEAGEPTPEGVHRDGVDYVLVLMIDRENIESGTTTIHALDGALLGSFTLARALDSALVVDTRVYHGVTAVTALDPDQPAHRDVLVATFKAIGTDS
jgi:hypothetical protein